ncbi:MAG TPA: hypothetical protein EYO61_01590 [Campylobacterales bacterium]|nr:hypothetical protein [Campylobacterales bacterium]
MIIEKFRWKLLSLVEANIPIIHIESYDIETVDREIAKLFPDYEIHEFHTGNRVIDFKTKKRIRYCQPVEFLEKFDSQEKISPSILLLKDFETNFRDNKVLYYLKSIAFKKLYREGFELTTILVSNNLYIPNILNGFTSSVSLPNPDLEELIYIVEDFANSMRLKLEQNQIREIAKILIGLDRVEVLKVLNRNYQIDGYLNFENFTIRSEKSRELIEKLPKLRYIETTSSLKDIGGMSHIKEYIRVVSKIYDNYEEAIKFGVDIPKIIVIYGDEGVGKRLAVQAFSNIMRMPIISFSFQHVEDLEELKQLLHSVFSIGEAILWLNSLNSDITLFDELLSLIRRSKSKVFTIITTDKWKNRNRIWDFDEVFKIDLPNEFERDEIFRIHLNKRGQLSKHLDIYRLVKNSRGLSGGEIEFAIKKGIEKAFIEDRKLETDDILVYVNRMSETKI